MEEMGAVLHDFGAGGVRPPDLRNILQCGSSSNLIFWIGDLGDDPQDQADPWRIPPQGGPPFGRNAAEVRNSGVVVVPDFGFNNGGSGPSGG